MIAFVCQKARGRRHRVQQCGSGGDVCAIAGAEGKGGRYPASICQRMDFGGWTATRAPVGAFEKWGMNFRRAFPPWADRWARTAVLSMLRSSGNSACDERVVKMRP